MKCPYCETENNQGELFCTECGGQLTENTVSAVSVNKPEKGPAAGLVPGASLQNGRYVISKALGEGGMGSVLLAKDTRLADKLTVVKVLSAESSATEKLQEDVLNFKREAETLAHLTHPLIPDVTDHFEEGKRYYMVMSYVEGENLEHWLERTHQPMKEQDALRYALEVLDILEYLSKQQPAIVHRDIKPANLIIGAKDQHVHLVDFGIARANTMIDGQRRKTTALGTPGYAPPEQYQGYADPRSDLYALAATLHHLLTNRDPGEYAPFQFPPIRTLNPRLSPQLEQILIKALKTNASERYQTPQEMRLELESLVAGTSTISNTDGYRLSGSIPLRALPPRPTRQRPVEPAASAPDQFESFTQTRERKRQQQQQMQEPTYLDPDYYRQRQQPRPRQTFQQRPPRQFIPPRQRPGPYGYRNDYTRQQENQIMWQFILFISAVCFIGLIAYVLFSSLHLY
ncbi:MAG TPA: protein kinase [Ktedonobacteraceae bacterium]|nr:protein kinase [Ktedonobacteraceae bacterium]